MFGARGLGVEGYPHGARGVRLRDCEGLGSMSLAASGPQGFDRATQSL